MAKYEFKCAGCDMPNIVESPLGQVPPNPTCPKCNAMMARVWGAAVTFKGSGFYKTDSRPKQK